MCSELRIRLARICEMTWAEIEGGGGPRADTVDVEGSPVSFETIVERTPQDLLWWPYSAVVVPYVPTESLVELVCESKTYIKEPVVQLTAIPVYLAWLLVAAQAFSRSWYCPNWLSLGGVGRCSRPATPAAELIR